MNEQQQLPPGYSLRRDACRKLVFVALDNRILRDATKQPKRFTDEDAAIKFAWQYHQHEEVRGVI